MMGTLDSDVIETEAEISVREVYVLESPALIVGSILLRNSTNAFHPFLTILLLASLSVDSFLRKLRHYRGLCESDDLFRRHLRHYRRELGEIAVSLAPHLLVLDSTLKKGGCVAWIGAGRNQDDTSKRGGETRPRLAVEFAPS